MSNFEMPDLYRLYDIFQPHFGTLAEESEGNNVHFEVHTTPDGMIEFSSREYFEENNKSCVRIHTIKQGKMSIEESSKTQILKISQS